MTVLFSLLTQFSILLTIISKVENAAVSYTTENFLQIEPLTERQSEELGWTYKWTERHCSPGTFITGYKFSYKDDTDSLEHIAAVCSNLNEKNSQGSQVGKKVLSVRVAPDGHHHTDQDMNIFTLSSSSLPASYANGFISLHVHGTQKAGRTIRHGLAFQNHPLHTSIELMKGQQDGERFRNLSIENVMVSKCTQRFALCGISAEIASLNDDSVHNAAGQAHIHQLLFHCCYACTAREIWLPVGTGAPRSRSASATGSGEVHVPVRIGVEFHRETAQLRSSLGKKVGGVDVGFNWSQDKAANRTSPLLVAKHPMAIHLRYSTFGAKLVAPRVTAHDNSDNGSIAAGTGDGHSEQVFHKLPQDCLNTNCTNKGGSKDGHCYCYDDQSLRTKTEEQNDEFTPRIRWCGMHWRTIWTGAKDMLLFSRAMDTVNAFSHNWENESEIFEDIRVEKARFLCNGAEGSECQFYQSIGQCGLMNVYLPYFCVCVQPATSTKKAYGTA